ncbi:DNA recombination protein RmuC [Nocardioides daejeonensis]|uniref:DNA recombination protein RmuC n=1 Tax=Nocardioides daejeonensis TaxID=1046556 RepID=UPI000D748312|nr:DNA recombination protein RmuC [Nocardioides daejeonensis]
MEIALLLLGLALGIGVGTALGWLAASLRAGRAPSGDVAAVTEALADKVGRDADVHAGLRQLQEQLTSLERERAHWQGQIRQQVEEVRLSATDLRRETTALGTALRRPQVRGRWGELQLRRAVELAGMLEHCDFTEQQSLTTADGIVRPDLVVHLAGGRHVVVDSKVPLDAFLDVTEAGEPEESRHHLGRHAAQVRQHVDALSAKRYWRAVDLSPDFVVLYLPGEGLLSAALEADRSLLEHAAGRNVVLATPTTLIALLKTVALGWSQAQVAERAREIHELGRDLHARLGVMGGHLDKLGRSLRGSVEAFNATVGSLEGRVLVTARNLEELGAGESALEAPARVIVEPRSLTARELRETG